MSGHMSTTDQADRSGIVHRPKTTSYHWSTPSTFTTKCYGLQQTQNLLRLRLTLRFFSRDLDLDNDLRQHIKYKSPLHQALRTGVTYMTQLQYISQRQCDNYNL